MSKAKDFSDDLQVISESVQRDVGAVMKLVREEQSAQSKLSSPDPKKLPTQANEGEGTDSEQAPPASTHTRPAGTPRPRKRTAPGDQIILENVTTRLRRETNELLTEAALRQRLKKETPATRQDIVEEALGDWLRKHRYLV